MVNGYSFIQIRQMAALVRRALAKVCTVPVLLVCYGFIFMLTISCLGYANAFAIVSYVGD